MHAFLILSYCGTGVVRAFFFRHEGAPPRRRHEETQNKVEFNLSVTFPKKLHKKLVLEPDQVRLVAGAGERCVEPAQVFGVNHFGG